MFHLSRTGGSDTTRYVLIEALSSECLDLLIGRVFASARVEPIDRRRLATMPSEQRKPVEPTAGANGGNCYSPITFISPVACRV